MHLDCNKQTAWFDDAKNTIVASNSIENSSIINGCTVGFCCCFFFIKSSSSLSSASAGCSRERC
jgi:hypothetical protein